MTPRWPDGSSSNETAEQTASVNEDGLEKFQKTDLDSDERPRARSARERLLTRIAASLNTAEAELLQGTPTSRDIDAVDAPDQEESHALAAECVELVRLYSGIADPAKRRQWLELIRAATEDAP